MTATTCITSHPVTGTHGQWGKGVDGACVSVSSRRCVHVFEGIECEMNSIECIGLYSTCKFEPHLKSLQIRINNLNQKLHDQTLMVEFV